MVRWVGGGQGARLRRAVGLLAPRVWFRAIVAQQAGFGPFCTLSFDCDFPRDVEVLPQVAALLERYGFAGSFACIGQWIRQFAEPHRRLVAAGHEVINHTDTHPNLYHPEYDYARAPGLSRERFNRISPQDRRNEIERCHETCAEVLDCAPSGFRAPHFGALHMDDVYPVLRELGYAFSSSVTAASAPGGGVPFRTGEGLWEFPVSPCPEHPFGVLDSWHSLGKLGASHSRPGELAALFADLGETVERNGGYVNVYLDPRVSLESGELESMLQFLRGRSIPVLVYGDLAGRLDETVGNKESTLG